MGKESFNKKIITKKHLARVERERIQRRNILTGTFIVLGLVILLIGYGIVDTYLLRPLQPVAEVAGEDISTREFQARARYARQGLIQRYYEMVQFSEMFGDDPSTQQYLQSSMSQITFQLDSQNLGMMVLDNLIEERLIRQEAKRLGITVSKEELDQAVQEAFGFFASGTPTAAPQEPTRAASTLSPTQLALISPTPTLEPTAVPTATVTATAPVPTALPQATATPYTLDGFQQDYQDTLKSFSDSIDFKEADILALFEAQILREKVMDAVIGELPREQEQVWTRVVISTDEESARQAYEVWKGGEDYNLVLSNYGSGTYGGDLGWLSYDAFEPAFSEAAFNLEVGEISEPVLTSDGWYVIQLLGKEVRPLDTNTYDQMRESKFSEWLTLQREAANVEINDIWMDRVPQVPPFNPVG
jgi:parvulin-like peptidyl-prolyl isomerase